MHGPLNAKSKYPVKITAYDTYNKTSGTKHACHYEHVKINSFFLEWHLWYCVWRDNGSSFNRFQYCLL